mgnify:CR=1 FL=1
MNEFIETFGDITLSQVLVFGVAMAFVIAVLAKGSEWFIKLYEKKQDECGQISTLVSSVNEMGANLETSMNRVSMVEDKLDLMEKENNNYRLASLRDKIFKDYQFYMAQEKITDSQLRNFENNVKEYSSRGGNSVVLHKYAPEVRELPVIGDRDLGK